MTLTTSLKTIENYIRFTAFLHKEIDAFLFSVPEQFFNGAPLLLLQATQPVKHDCERETFYANLRHPQAYALRHSKKLRQP